MSSTAILERRLRVGAELLSVVSTMKGLAAVSIHEFEQAVHALRQYTQTLELGLQVVLPDRAEPLSVDAQPSKRVVAVVVGTDQGMCGPINREIAQVAARWFDDQSVSSEERWVVSMGTRVTRELDAAGVTVDDELPLASSVEGVGPLVEELILRIDRWRHQHGVGRVMVVHQHPLGRTRREPRVSQVIPPDGRRLAAIASRPWPTKVLPGTPHGRDEALAGLLRQDLLIALFRAIAEAKAAEHGARLSAMQAAEQNIEERLERLRNEYHQLRQAHITSELLDVVSSFEVLRSD